MGYLKETDALEFVDHLISLYFCERNLPVLTQYMEKHTVWIGSGKGELSRTMQEATKLLADDLSEYQDTFEIKEKKFTFMALSDCHGIVYGILKAIPKDPALSDEELRISAVLQQKEDGLKLIHMHSSHADVAQEQGKFFVKKSMREDNESLRMALTVRDRQLANLTKNIPGGAHQCANNASLTLLSMSDGFLSMFGYSRAEIEERFAGSYLHMVYPGDRAKMMKTIQEQLLTGRDIEVEYRVLCKNGHPLWVLDKGRLIDDGNGVHCFYCVLIDITKRQQQQEELRLSLERHKVIMDQATDIIFEWDILHDTLDFSLNWKKKFGYEAIDQNISNQIPLSENIHPDDMAAFIRIMKDTAEGVPYSETEFRIKDANSCYSWCRIRATTQFDSDRQPVKAIGVIVDIDEEKKQKQMLIQQAQYDALTGIYNKATINALVEQRMQGNGMLGYQVLLIIDVDYFKKVNDTYGHLCGDFVLSNVAAALKSGTRATDLVGRIGGDEFLIYLPEVMNESFARQKADQILKAVSTICPEPGAAPITCSIGAVIMPHGEIAYHTLYQYADHAVYQQKKNGRSGVTFFDAQYQEDNNSTQDSAIGNSIVSDEGNVADEWLAQYSFRTLYNACDIEGTLHRLLEVIGRSFDVSRVYIFESNANGEYCSNTFEWCSDGISSEIDQLQNISYVDELKDYAKNFDAQGIFYCPDINTLHPDVYQLLKAQGIHSMLQCAVLDEGRFAGYVGFDECRENRAWSNRQVASFKLTADVISTFLIKLRLKQRLHRNVTDAQIA